MKRYCYICLTTKGKGHHPRRDQIKIKDMRLLHPVFPILLLITGIFLWRAEVGLFGLHFVVAGLFSFIFTLKTNEDEN